MLVYNLLEPQEGDRLQMRTMLLNQYSAIGIILPVSRCLVNSAVLDALKLLTNKVRRALLLTTKTVNVPTIEERVSGYKKTVKDMSFQRGVNLKKDTHSKPLLRLRSRSPLSHTSPAKAR